MKRYTPEKGEIRYNGVRQYLDEDLSYLMELTHEIAWQEAVVRLTGEEALRKHIGKLRDLLSKSHSEFRARWNREITE